MSKRILTEDEITDLKAYGKKKWPDEQIVVSQETDDKGEPKITHSKITETVMPDNWKPADLKKGK